MSVLEGGTAASPSEAAAVDLSPAALRRRYSALFQPNPVLYYADMLASAAVGWGAFAVTLSSPRFSPAWGIAVFVAIFALYRAVLFIHELSHLKRGSVPGFDVAWSLLVGFPLLVPSLMYLGSHGEHHRTNIFGTDKDPEYMPIGDWNQARVVGSLVPLMFVPVLLILRWAVLGPLSYLVPPLRGFVVGYMSTLVINPVYKRRLPEGRMVRRWAMEEAGCAVVCWSVALAMSTGVIGTDWILDWAFVMGSILVFNHVRTLVAHRYHNHGESMDLLQQYQDSVNISGGGWLDMLLAPVGLRFHALHHLLPTVPYHALGAIHRQMMAELPKASPYAVAEEPTVMQAVAHIFGERSFVAAPGRR